MPDPAPIHYEGIYCDLSVEAPAPGVVVVTFAGHDVGTFGAFPTRAVEQHLASGLAGRDAPHGCRGVR